MRDQEPHRPPVLGRERLAVVREGQEVGRSVEVGKRHVGGEALLRMRQHEPS